MREVRAWSWGLAGNGDREEGGCHSWKAMPFCLGKGSPKIGFEAPRASQALGGISSWVGPAWALPVCGEIETKTGPFISAITLGLYGPLGRYLQQLPSHAEGKGLGRHSWGLRQSC